MPAVKVLLADDHVVVRAGLRNALAVVPNLEIAGEVGNGLEMMYSVALLQAVVWYWMQICLISSRSQPSASSKRNDPA